MTNKKQTEEQLSALRRSEEEKVAQQTAAKLNLPYLPPNLISPKSDLMLLTSAQQTKNSRLLIISQEGEEAITITDNPNRKAIEDLTKFLESKGLKLKLYLVSKTTFEENYELQKRFEEKKEFLKTKLVGEIKISSELLSEFYEKIKNLNDFKNIIDLIPESKIRSILELIIVTAIKTDSSDIHLEYQDEGIIVRLRIDGVLHTIAKLPLSVYKSLISRIKILSGLKINVTKTAQDGRFSIFLGKTTIDVRVSTLPGPKGENVVMRLLNPEKVLINIENLGLSKEHFEILERNLKKTIGMILTTGPTGAGKTTTLYACLNKINSPDVKIITIEDPIEYKLAGIEQTQVNPENNYTFASGLRAIVRQDPDVILVGEMRDLETVEIAINAALTGHLVFSTLHTNDAPGAILRLIQMGAKKEIFAPAINLIMAQRLVRKLCPLCKKEVFLTEEQVQKIKDLFSNSPGNLQPKVSTKTKIYEVQGCEQCNFIGYKGRIGVFEMFEINSEIQQLIISNPSLPEIKKAAVKNGMVTLIQDGYFKILDGITTIEEVERVVGV